MTVYSGGQNICGATIGVLCLDSRFAKPPGHIKNPSGLTFPVLYETVKGATVQKILDNPSRDFIVPFLLAAKRLEGEGVLAITGSCGFLALFQRELADSVNIPVFSSSLIQIPLAYNLSGCKSPVGVLTASSKSLTEKHFQAVGAGNIPVVIQGMEDTVEFSEVILQGKRTCMDLAIIEQEVLSAVEAMISDNRDLAALVLECTDLPPYAHRIQYEFGIPVYDIMTLATMVHSVVMRTPYTGYMLR